MEIPCKKKLPIDRLAVILWPVRYVEELWGDSMKLDFATTALLSNMALSGMPPLQSLSPEEARAAFSEMSRGNPDGPELASRDVDIPVDGGTIRGRVISPKGPASSVLVYYHGGGWVIGNIDDYHALGCHLAQANQAIVVMVDYRKAPEHAYPIPLEDAVAGLRWTDAHRADLGADGLPLIIAGDSAGGNLAAAVAQSAAAGSAPQVDLQVLIYPVTDGRMETASFSNPDNQTFLTAETMAYFWDHYADAQKRLEPGASPLLAEDLRGVAPAIVITAEFDILCDEGQAYANKLSAAGVPTVSKCFSKQMHGFFSMPDVLPAGGEAIQWVAQEVSRMLAPPQSVDAVIVGAGFAGMYQLIRFREMGLSIRVFEAGADVGGTWYWNRYPGARVDIESMSYSYSFSEELQQDWVWSEKYSTQPELLRYSQHVAERFDLRRDITFETRVVSAHYDDDRQEWLITTDTGERVAATYFVMATGTLSVAKTPDINGAGNFAGDTYFTSSWPHEGVDFSGKRVAVIGTGSSGVQSIPMIAEQASQLDVYQRTPAYTTPAFNRNLTNSEVDERKSDYSAYRERQRWDVAGIPDPERSTERALDASPEERSRRYQEAWDSGVLTALMAQYGDLLVDEKANQTVQEFIHDKIRKTVKDPKTAETLLPKAYPYGTKRPCIDTGYYETFNLDHVSLISLRETPIETITPKGIRTSDQEREYDAIVFATGFDAMTGALLRVDIRGRDGLKLSDAWADGPRSYLGLAVSGFPNLFTVTGPSSPSVLSNMLVSIEQHVDWITDCVQWLRDHDYRSIEASAEAEDDWADHTAHLASLTLFPKADSWYMGANVPGKKRMFMAYVGGVGVYRAICDQVAATGYDGFVAR